MQMQEQSAEKNQDSLFNTIFNKTPHFQDYDVKIGLILLLQLMPQNRIHNRTLTSLRMRLNSVVADNEIPQMKDAVGGQ